MCLKKMEGMEMVDSNVSLPQTIYAKVQLSLQPAVFND